MAGMASRPTTVSVAPTTPLVAAKITHMMTVPTARPPGMRRVHMWMASNRREAMPDASNMAPMKMNSGTAASTCAVATSSIFWMNWYCRPSKPKECSPNTTASAIMVSATGNPVRITAMSAGNIQSALIGRFLPAGSALERR